MNTIQRLILSGSLLCALLLTACDDHHKNHPPTAVDANVTTPADTLLHGTLTGNDVDGNALTFAVVTASTQGTVVVNINGSYVYTPMADSTGTDQFTFRTYDSMATSIPATVNITINPVDVAFGNYSLTAYAQEPTAQPLSLNSRTVQLDVTDPTAYDTFFQ